MQGVLSARLQNLIVCGCPATVWKSACKRDPRRRRIWTHLRHTIHPYTTPSKGSLLCWFVLLDRLAEPVALGVHLEDVAVMCQPVQQGLRHAFTLEDLAPFAERQVAGDQQTGAFIPIGEDLEQQLGTGPAEGQVAQFIADQQVRSVQLPQHSVQLVLLLGFL